MRKRLGYNAVSGINYMDMPTIMSDALKTLEIKFSENEKKLSALVNEAEILKKNNEHLAYSIEVLKKQSLEEHQSNQENNTDKKTLRATVLDIFKDDELITVGEAWERVKEQGFDTTRATINTTMHTLVKTGALTRPEIGQYKKAT